MYYVRNHKCITDASPGDRARIAFPRNTRGRVAPGAAAALVALAALAARSAIGRPLAVSVQIYHRGSCCT